MTRDGNYLNQMIPNDVRINTGTYFFVPQVGGLDVPETESGNAAIVFDT